MNPKSIIKQAYPKGALDNSEFQMFSDKVAIQIAVSDYMGTKTYHIRLAEVVGKPIQVLSSYADNIDAMNERLNELKTIVLPERYKSEDSSDLFQSQTYPKLERSYL